MKGQSHWKKQRSKAQHCYILYWSFLNFINRLHNPNYKCTYSLQHLKKALCHRNWFLLNYINSTDRIIILTIKKSCFLIRHLWLSVCSYAKMVGAKHVYSSAKLNQGVEDLFLELTREMMEKYDDNSQKDVNRTSRVLVVDDEATTPSSCCSGFRSN